MQNHIPNSLQMDDEELIILAAPGARDHYYTDYEAAIFDFHVEFVRKILEQGDQVLILVPGWSYDRYVEALGEKHIILAPMQDIWIRDFTAVNPENPLLFRYSAAGQGGGIKGQSEADFVQQKFLDWLAPAELRFRQILAINDGGNWVEDGAGNLVLSRKFLRDNHFSEKQARKYLQDETGVTHIAFIEADEQGGLEHADGVVSFIGPNHLLVNDYSDDRVYERQLHHDLKKGLPGVKLTKIVTAYSDQDIYDSRFGSACGLYTNALVTPRHIYLPQFGLPEDVVAIRQLTAVTDKRIIPVQSSAICAMGGGVRCMSWQLRGENKKRLLRQLERLAVADKRYTP